MTAEIVERLARCEYMLEQLLKKTKEEPPEKPIHQIGETLKTKVPYSQAAMIKFMKKNQGLTKRELFALPFFAKGANDAYIQYEERMPRIREALEAEGLMLYVGRYKPNRRKITHFITESDGKTLFKFKE